MKKSILAIASVGVLFATTPASAEGLQIKYDDLNLSSVEGQKILDSRIDRAAKEACGLNNQTTGTRVPSRSAQKCFNEVKKSATAQMAVLVDEQRLGG